MIAEGLDERLFVFAQADCVVACCLGRVFQYWTPNTVTPGEAVLTALFFPVLVTLSYMADIGMLGKFSSGDAVRPRRRGLSWTCGSCIERMWMRTARACTNGG